MTVNYRTLILTLTCSVDNQYLCSQFLYMRIETNQSKLTDKSYLLCGDVLKKTATHSESSLDSKQIDFSVHHMTSLARHFLVLTHTLELHTKHHVNISGSQKTFSECF